MDREGFRNRLKQYKLAREENPGLKYWEWRNAVSTEENPIYYSELEDLNNQLSEIEPLLKERKNIEKTLINKRLELSEKHKVPYLKDKEITLTNAGSMTGARLTTNLLDSIAKYANKTGLSLLEAIGLAALETTFGQNIRLFNQIRNNSNYDDYYAEDILSDWRYKSRDVNEYLEKKLNAPSAEATRLRKESYDYTMSKTNRMSAEEYEKSQILHKRELLLRAKDEIDFIINNYNDFEKAWSDYETKTVPPFEHAFQYYKTGKYNPGDPAHTDMVKLKGAEVMLSPEFKNWFKNVPKYDEGGKVIPTQEEYITQQIAAEKAAALKRSYDRQYPKVPTSGGKRSKADWENSLNRLEEYLNTLLSRWGITPSQKTIWLNNLKALQSQREAGYDAYIGEGKILGPSCAYTTGDNYGIDCTSSELFRLNHANYGFREIPYSQVQPSDVVLDYNPAEQRATHTMMYSKKGSDGVARFNHSNGGHTAEAIRKDARYPFKGQPLAYEFVGIPADSTQWINDYKKLYGFAEGGEVDQRQLILNRANEVSTNYSDAKDFTLDPLNYAVRKIAKTLTGRGGISNCTLSATGWVDPNNQYMSARNIFDNPDSGYIEIDKAYALPGDLLISKNPTKDSYHTMLIEDFNGDDPLLRYSRGGHDTEKNLVTGRSLAEYHRLDNEQGGNHTEDHYFRYRLPNEYWLPEIVVTPKK